MNSRKERRGFAKKMGVKSKDETFKEKMERIKRAQQYGKILHINHLEQQENSKNSDGGIND